MKTLISILILVTSLSCVKETPFEPKPISFTEISKGNTGINNNLNQQLLIMNEDEWQQSFSFFSQGIVNELSDLTIDFENFMVLTAIDVNRPDTGFSIEITAVTEQENNIVVSLATTNTGSGFTVIIQPYHIVKIPKSSKPIVFQ